MKKLTCLLLACCMLVVSACSENAYQRALKAGHAVGHALDTGNILLPQLQAEGLLTADEVARAGDLILRAKTATAEFNQLLESNRDFDPKSREQIFALVDQVVSAVERLQSEGVVRIKSERAQERIRRIVVVIRLALQGVKAFLDVGLTARIEALPGPDSVAACDLSG